MPVHWDPLLPGLAPGTPATVHGLPSRDRVVVVDVAGTMIWQSAGGGPPRRPAWTPTAAEPAAAAPVGLVRHVRADAALLFAAPVAGLLWAYLDGSGAASWAAATALAAGVLLWLPTVTGSDPT